ncbi:SAM-dependent methyltransferase [Kitasatospora sp. A2-31]|uniref:SAM-dependent methyltransferase n=1 Tax=Kitasatospora sp. A2-31 TaxID=2916414 RepID=UPI0027E261AB|nr:SAM-dependent methyltransferase [Kitasatospora sp. A2-31]
MGSRTGHGPSHAIDTSIPSAARMYDRLLGGTLNFEADRLACEELLRTAPSIGDLAVNNRWFLERVVRYLASECDIHQFIDHGSGLPTEPNVHQVAQEVHGDARVAYVDNDPIVIAYGRTSLDVNSGTRFIDASMTDTGKIFDEAGAGGFIDFTEPVAALFVSVIHCLKDSEQPQEMIRRVRDRLVPGSYLVICQLVSDDESVRRGITELMEHGTEDNWGRVRQKEDVRAYFDGMAVLDPYLCDVTHWRPDSELRRPQKTHEVIEFGGVARV